MSGESLTFASTYFHWATPFCYAPPFKMSLKVSVPGTGKAGEQSLSYDATMLFWRVVTQIFFREVRPRGAFHIPREGPVIFVGAPHNNQVP